MLSFTVLTIAGAFDRQLPPPPNHFRLAFLFSVGGPEAAGVLDRLATGVGSAIGVLEAAFWGISASFGLFDDGFVELVSVGVAGSGVPWSAGA
jgi:hypothetical protein